MSLAQGEFVGKLPSMAKIENHLAAILSQTAGQVAHTECFDTEQRSEIYAILESMKADTEANRNQLGHWVSHHGEEVGDV